MVYHLGSLLVRHNCSLGHEDAETERCEMGKTGSSKCTLTSVPALLYCKEMNRECGRCSVPGRNAAGQRGARGMLCGNR